MPRKRARIPKSIKDSILLEYNHKCAICGKERPQLHHIDKNPNNNDPNNIIPLCPNCHLTDQHNPTADIDMGILKLFRVYKDPILLTPQFYPIYRRFRYLYELKENDLLQNILAKANDLIGFIRSFNSGEYYAHQVEILLRDPLKRCQIELHEIGTGKYGTTEDIMKKYVGIIKNNVKPAEHLLVEQLRYQGWKHDAS